MKTWTDEETRILLSNYNRVSNMELFALLPNKSEQAIYKKAYKCGLRKKKEIERLNRSESRKRERGSNWKGGKRKTTKGYIQVLMPNHPRADSSGYVMEHIAVWEEKTGINVPHNCCIHHLNGDKSDNRIENLCLMDFGAHTIFHRTGTHIPEDTRRKISDSRRKRNC